MMSGYLITYTSSNKRDIAKINYYLFGRITTIKQKKYYYKGELENINYTKICNGCYFVSENINNFNGLLELTPVTINLDNRNLINARDYWNEFIQEKELTVLNWKK